MKILVIGSARTRSTVLVEMLREQNPKLKCLYEFYTYNPQKTIEDNTRVIHKNNQFILKILGHNIKSEEDISKLQLESFDKIHLINRKNYFHQCCSLQVSLSSKIWHDRNNNAFAKIKDLQYELNITTVKSIIQDVTNFCKIQNYLQNNNIDYQYYWYENLFDLLNVPQKRIVEANLEYNKIISNYNEYKQVCDTMFNERFIYGNNVILK
jgi:uncharacterized protein YcfL